MDSKKKKLIPNFKKSLSSLEILSSNNRTITNRNPNADNKTTYRIINNYNYDVSYEKYSNSNKSRINIYANDHFSQIEENTVKHRYHSIINNDKFSFFKSKTKSKKLISLKNRKTLSFNTSQPLKPVFIGNSAMQEIELKSHILDRVDDFRKKLESSMKSLKAINDQQIEYDNIKHIQSVDKIINRIKIHDISNKKKGKYISLN